MQSSAENCVYVTLFTVVHSVTLLVAWLIILP
jgi:hypothetical protein